MLKKACLLCKIVGALAIVGALNWGAVGVLNLNLVERFFGEATTLTRAIYGVIGLSGLALLASYFMVCPACKK
jgi:uncharacterized membrane protein YuzA (DUF378 family)